MTGSARDRFTEYARAVTIAAPGAVQKARRSLATATKRSAASGRSGRHRRSGTGAGARYEQVRRRHLAGEPLMSIAHALSLARGTVRKFAHAESFPARLPHGPAPSILDPHLPHLERRLAEGCENGMVLWRELHAMRLAGGNKQVHRWLAERQTGPAKVGRRRVDDLHDTGTAMGRGKAPPLPAARQLAWLLVQPVAALDATAATVVRRVEQDRDTAIAADLARRFTVLVRARGLRGRMKDAIPPAPVAELDAWLAKARACGIGAVETFAAGLEMDGAAVRAALTEPWSSGQAEEQVNRLKLLKRQSYGRASFDLLRRRVLLAA